MSRGDKAARFCVGVTKGFIGRIADQDGSGAALLALVVYTVYCLTSERFHSLAVSAHKALAHTVFRGLNVAGKRTDMNA